MYDILEFAGCGAPGLTNRQKDSNQALVVSHLGGIGPMQRARIGQILLPPIRPSETAEGLLLSSGCSSTGRALDSKPRCCRFDPCQSR